MDQQTIQIEVLNPRGEIESKPSFAPSQRFADLNGKRIGLYSNGKPGMNNFYIVLEELLKIKYPEATVSTLSGAFEITDKDVQGWASQIDTFVYAVGD